ncbi:MAG: glycoside hydrolase family 19 protein [Polyangiaceae bacterium]
MVENVGRYFQCKPFPFSGWCSVRGYEPGTGLYWQDAWDEVASCGGVGGSGGSGGSTGGTGGSTGGSGGSTAGTGGSTAGTGGSGGSGGSSGGTGFSALISESQFNAMFPNRNNFYSYWDLVSATATYPAFAGTGDDTTKKREVAAFLANMAHETGELVYIEEIAKGEYCAPSPSCPCAPGKRYYGRGPIQLSWNYNYCAAGQALGLNLQADPDLVARDAKVAWQTGLWFWMTQTGAGSQTAHNGIVGGSFAETIRTINGSLECNGGNPAQVQARVSYYEQFCALLGVSPGNNLYC